MADVDLSARFPELRPTRTPPPLYNLFGCGLMLYGQRDFDLETESFVQTLWLCVLHVPIIALRSYRVVREEDGWLVLGREEVSTQAKIFSLVIVLLGCGGGGYFGVRAYTTSPAYVAKQKLAEAERLAAVGRFGDAAKLWNEVAVGPAAYAEPAARRLAAMLEDPAVKKDPEALTAAIHAAVSVHGAGRWPGSVQSVCDTGVALAEQVAPKNPAGAVALLDAVSPLASNDQEEKRARLRHDLLERLVAADPTNLDWAVPLAADFASQGKFDRCESLLEPFRGRLGDGASDGARVLALADARAGRLEPALALLRPYVKGRVDRLGRAEEKLKALYQSAQGGIIDQLQNQRARDFDYQTFRQADEAGRQAILGQYMAEKLKDRPEIAAAQQELLAEANVVPVALELGMLLLQHAQSQSDPKARKSELDEAEASFLAVSRLAGEQSEYQLSLGQVYYWQGKHREGRALFDQVLKAQNREPKLLMQVATLLRNVGSDSDARTLAGEGYNAASDAEVKSACAVLCGLVEKEPDQRIEWLRRANTQSSNVKAILSCELADQALRQGDEPKAINHLREAVALYENMPESVGKLNNESLALRQLAALTGEQADYERGGAMIEKAAALNPGDSLTMSNAAESLLESSLRDIIGRAIDLTLIRRSASIDLFGLLISDEAGRTALAARLRSHPGVNRAMALMDKVNLLAPRNANFYGVPLRVLSYRQDVEGLRKLRRRLEGIDLELTDSRRKAQETYSGARDAESKREAQASLPRFEAILTSARTRGGPTFAAAAATAIGGRIHAALYGIYTDRDALVALAEEAFAVAPSLGSRWGVQQALLVRAEHRLKRADPDLNVLDDRFHRSTSPEELIAAVLSTDGRLKELVLKDADVIRAIDLLRESFSASPTYSSSGRSWNLLRSRYPDEAAAMAKTLIASDSERLLMDISTKLTPYDPTSALEAYWWARMEGEDQSAVSILREYKNNAVPIPIEIP